jgi:hypothetical protein
LITKREKGEVNGYPDICGGTGLRRVPAALFQAARRAAGLPPSASQGEVMRYAMAIAAGLNRAEASAWSGGIDPADLRELVGAAE